MIDRRGFMMASSLTGMMTLGAAAQSVSGPAPGRQVYELRTYHLDTAAQAEGLKRFLAEAAIPALTLRHGLPPVGVFETPDAVGPIYVLLAHPSAESVTALGEALRGDAEYLERGADFLNAPAARPAYARMESSILLAFTGMPVLHAPAEGPDRVFQLRIYESPSVKTGQKKIEMFNTGEIDIFQKTGLAPVFFGEAIAGAKMPNLTYMLGFNNAVAQKAAWEAFKADPEWKALSARPEYANEAILCGITNIELRPAACSQI